MVISYHAIFTAYGFWLPNDPRGSWSDYVRRWELLRFGKATKTDERRSLARTPHDHHLRQQAKQALKYEPVSFSGRQALSISVGFRNAVARSSYVLYACSILPEHVHAVIARNRYHIEHVVGQLKGEATKQLKRDGLHPFAHLTAAPSPWVRNGWNVYLNSDRDIGRAVRYVEQNPIREGKPAQRWQFITPFDAA